MDIKLIKSALHKCIEACEKIEDVPVVVHVGFGYSPLIHNRYESLLLHLQDVMKVMAKDIAELTMAKELTDIHNANTLNNARPITPEMSISLASDYITNGGWDVVKLAEEYQPVLSL